MCVNRNFYYCEVVNSLQIYPLFQYNSKKNYSSFFGVCGNWQANPKIHMGDWNNVNNIILKNKNLPYQDLL